MPKSPYFGGELRQDTSSANASVILANQVGGWNNIKEACAAMVLEKILGKQHYSRLGCKSD